MPIESAGEVLLLARNPRLYPFDPAHDKDRRKRYGNDQRFQARNSRPRPNAMNLPL